MTTDAYPLHANVMDLLLDAVCIVDTDGHFVFVSAACERIFGYTQQELIGKNMIDLVFPEDRERTLQAAREIMNGHLKTNFENRYVRKDGQIVDIMWSARWSESDRLRLAVARDITELKQQERIRNALYRISEAAHETDGLFALCQQIHEIIGNLLIANNFLVAFYDKQQDVLTFPYFVDERRQPPEVLRMDSDNPLSQVIHTGQPLLETCTDRGTFPVTGPDTAGDYIDWLGVPLISQQGIIGALAVKSHTGDIRYTENDKDLLQFVSTQITNAIERKQAETKLLHKAGHDSLTDLPNRTLFQDRFEMAIRRAHRDGEHLALLYIDLNDFKHVNDTYGHETGDQLLREVAQRLKQSVREADTVGRRGGDEFTVLLTNIQGPDIVDNLVEKIRTAINTPWKTDRQTLTISASIGTAVYPQHGDNIGQLLHHADVDMYSSKRGI